MAQIVICEFIDERVLPSLRAVHDVLYDPTLVDGASRLKAECASADALIVRNRTQVRGDVAAQAVGAQPVSGARGRQLGGDVDLGRRVRRPDQRQQRGQHQQGAERRADQETGVAQRAGA